MHTVDIVERYNRGTRLLHAAIYLGVLVELISGWWFVLGNYRPSVVEELTGIGDQWVHEYAGLLMIPVAVLGCGIGWRAVRTFTAESLLYRASDIRWFRRWPRSVVSGRFEYHDGHFDPGQRIANIVMVLTLTTLLLTGVGALYLQRPFVLVVFQVHRWAAFLITPVLAGPQHSSSARASCRATAVSGGRCTSAASCRRTWPGGSGRHGCSSWSGNADGPRRRHRPLGGLRDRRRQRGARSRPGPDAGLGIPGVGSGPR